MADHFRKTDRGRREVRERSLQLSRPARNLLLILDSSRTLPDWTAMVQGASLSDGVALLEAGLIEAMPGPGGAESRPAAFEPTEPMGHDAWLAGSSGGARGDDTGRVTRPAPLEAPASAPMPFRDTPDSELMNTRWPSMPPGPPAWVPTLRPSGLPPMQPSVEPETPPQTPLQPAPSSQPMPLTAQPMPGAAAGTPGTAGGDPAALAPDGPGHSALGYTELYDSLNALLRETLGLFRGYRYTLRIERAQNAQELEAVAREFLAEVRRLRGDTMARMVARALGFGG